MRFIEISKPLVTRVLNESLLLEAEGKNTHMEHLEDNIFNKGNIIPDPLQMKFRECSDSFSGGIFKLR